MNQGLLIPYFTRRIGLSEAGEQVPIFGAGKLSGRVGDYEIGMTTAYLEESEGVFEHGRMIEFGTRTKAVTAGSLVEVIGTNKNNDGNVEHLRFTFADGSSTRMILRGKEGSEFTGITLVTLEASNGAATPLTCATLKITPANEIGVNPPGTVLVFPENATGNCSIVTESSNDLVAWTNLTTTLINVVDAPKFFRSRIIKTGP